MMRFALLLKGFRASAHGVAATEFALVLPFLAAIAVSLPDVSQATVDVIEMQGAARASIQYAMTGGTDIAEAKTLGLAAWNNKPADANLTTGEQCVCAGAGATCGQLCPDNTNPETYFTVTASGHVGGDVVGFENSVTRSVRIQ